MLLRSRRRSQPVADSKVQWGLQDKAAEIRTECELRRLFRRGPLMQNLCASADHCRLGCWNNLLFAVSLLLSGLATLANVDAALEVGAVFN
jgi:hypothetical protein